MTQELQVTAEMQTAIISVVGTLAGTALGWFLNNLSQRGKLRIYVSAFKEVFQYNNMGCMAQSSSIEQTDYYGYKLTLDLYNASGTPKIMRNLTVVFSDGKQDLFKSVPKDDETRRSSGPAFFYDDVGPINIPPKRIIQMRLHNGAHKRDGGLDFIWKTKKIYLTYTNEKNKLVKVNINSTVYANYFETHTQEGK